MALWKHLEKFHHSIYKDLKPSSTQNPLTNYFSKKSKYSGKTQELTKERCIDLIINTNTAFATLEHPRFEAFLFLFCIIWCVPSEWKHITMWHLWKIWWWKGKNATIVSTNWESVTHSRYLDYYKSFGNSWDHDSLDWWHVEPSWMCSCYRRVVWISWRGIHDKSVAWSASRLQFDG